MNTFLFDLPKRQPTPAMLTRRPLRQWMREQNVRVHFYSTVQDLPYIAYFAGRKETTDDLINAILQGIAGLGESRDDALQTLQENRYTNPLI
jgi:hypothetical protein